MAKSINFTNRYDISLDDVQIKAGLNDGQVIISAELDTSNYEFPPEARIQLNLRSAGVTTEDRT